MRARTFALSFFASTAVLLALAGCGGGNGATTVNSVTITPSTANVAPGAQVDFTATVNLSNTTTSTSTAVTWEANGVVGGNSTIGTIVSSSTDNQVGIYTAPAVVPTTNNGQVNITAVAQQSNVTGSTATTTTTATNGTTVTSNTAVVTVGVVLGFSISPTVSTIPAGSSVQFAATLNGVTDGNATWSVAATNGGNPGSIGTKTGVYVAPPLPPLGNSIIVTGQDGTNSATETITISYSDHSLVGPYAFPIPAIIREASTRSRAALKPMATATSKAESRTPIASKTVFRRRCRLRGTTWWGAMGEAALR